MQNIQPALQKTGAFLLLAIGEAWRIMKPEYE
jgi:hypothetical protein